MLWILLTGLVLQNDCPPNDTDWRFVGCSWSPQECSYSCAARGSFRAEYDPETCEMEQPGLEWACYCPIEN